MFKASLSDFLTFRQLIARRTENELFSTFGQLGPADLQSVRNH